MVHQSSCPQSLPSGARLPGPTVTWACPTVPTLVTAGESPAFWEAGALLSSAVRTPRAEACGEGAGTASLATSGAVTARAPPASRVPLPHHQLLRVTVTPTRADPPLAFLKGPAQHFSFKRRRLVSHCLSEAGVWPSGTVGPHLVHTEAGFGRRPRWGPRSKQPPLARRQPEVPSATEMKVPRGRFPALRRGGPAAPRGACSVAWELIRTCLRAPGH